MTSCITRVGISQEDEVERHQEDDDFDQVSDGGNVKQRNDETSRMETAGLKPGTRRISMYF